VAGQSITFDFLSRGSATVAGDFRKVGDNAALASRGAKVLADVIGKLGDKEDRTAAESKILARALRETGAAEDRVTARAVLADAAIRRLGDSMKDSQKKSDGLGKSLSGLKLNPGLVGPLLALAPAIATLGGVGAGAAAGLGGAFIAGGAALAAFGAVAKPILTDAKKAADAVGKAQDAYNTAIANGVPQAKAFKAEQLAIAKAYAGMSPAQVALAKQLGSMADAWEKVKAAQTPVVAGALQPWLKSVTGLTAALGPIIAKIAPVIQGLGGQFGALVNSSAFKSFRDFIGSTGSAAVSAGGSTIIDLVKSFMILLPKFDPLIREAVGWISRLGPAVLTWASCKKASDDITKFMQWFSANGPVVGNLLKNIGGALKALAPGLTAGGTAELQVMSGFFALVAKLPPGLAKPLAEVAGAMLILNKMGVVSVGVKLLGLGGAGGAASAAGAAAAGGAAAGGLWSKILPGVRLVGGALIAAVIIDTVLKSTPSGKGKNWLDNPFGQGTFTDPKTGKQAGSPSWLTSWSTAFKGSIAGKIAALFAAATASADKATAQIMADFAAQGKAASSAMTDVGTLTTAITSNGTLSSQAHDARLKLISDMTRAGVNADTAAADVVAYSNAVTNNGAKSTQAAGARAKLIGDILAASKNAVQGKTDLAAYTTAVQAHGTKSDAARGARQRLITDLVNSGLDAKAASKLVDGLGTSISRLPKSATVKIITEASGTGQIAITGTGWALGQGNIRFHAATGGRVPGFGGGDIVPAWIKGGGPALLEPGEAIVDKVTTRAHASDLKAWGVPGFAGGGFVGLENQFAAMAPSAGSIAGGDAGRAVRIGVAEAMAKAKAAVAAKAAAMNAVGPSSGGGHVGWNPGAGVNQWRQTTLKVLSMLGLSPGLVLDVLYQMMTESGGNPNIVNKWDSNWIAGHPSVGLMQVIRGTYQTYSGPFRNTGPFSYGVSVNPLANIYSALNYGAHNGRGFGTGPGQIGSGHGYAAGGLVPGFASGGTVGRQGAAWLRAWRARSGGGFGAAWGPIAVNEQIARMAAAAGRASTLAKASGLTAGQHRYWAATAADEKKRLGVLVRERDTERTWRTMLGGSDATLAREIAAAGHLPGLAGPVKGWKAQMAGQKRTIAGISKMLGYSDAQRAAIAKANPPAKGKPPVPTGVQATHSYGGDVANNLGTVRGGTLRPGYNGIWNMTGRPEPLVPARSGGSRLQVEWVGGNGGDDLERWIRKNVRIRGGGDVQKAYGAH
jgi:hypothetical protein